MTQDNFNAEYLQSELTDEQIDKLSEKLLEGYDDENEINNEEYTEEDVWNEISDVVSKGNKAGYIDDFNWKLVIKGDSQPDETDYEEISRSIKDGIDQGTTSNDIYWNLDVNESNTPLGGNIQPSTDEDEPIDSEITHYGKQYQTKKFNSVDSTNKFLRNHPEYGVISSNEDDTEVHVARMDESTLSAKDKSKLHPETFGTKYNGEEKYPLNDEEHVRSAISYFSKCPKDKQKALAGKIVKAAKKFGVKVGEDSKVMKALNESD